MTTLRMTTIMVDSRVMLLVLIALVVSLTGALLIGGAHPVVAAILPPHFEPPDPC